MCKQLKTCAAPKKREEEEGEQCTNLPAPDCDHCDVHRKKAKDLYMKYKNICAVAMSKNMDATIPNKTKKLHHLYHCYEWFIKAYNARWEHHTYAYVRSLWNEGHLKQLDLFQELMIRCEHLIEDHLLQLHRESKLDQQNNNRYQVLASDELEAETMESEPISLPAIKQTVTKFKKQRKDDTKYFNRMLDQDRQRQKKVQEARKLAVVPLVLHLQQITKDSVDFVQIATFNMFQELTQYGYFSEFWQPQECPNCACCGYEPYPFLLGCPCMLQKPLMNYILGTGMQSYDIQDTLKEMTQVQDAFQPFVDTLIELYKQEGTKLLSPTKLMYFHFENDELQLFFNMKLPKKRSEQLKEQRIHKYQLIQDYVENRNKPKTEVEQWKQNLSDLCLYIDENGCLPNPKSKNKETQQLHNWLEEQCEHFHHWTGLMSKHEIHHSFEKFLQKYHLILFSHSDDDGSESDESDEGNDNSDENDVAVQQCIKRIKYIE